MKQWTYSQTQILLLQQLTDIPPPWNRTGDFMIGRVAVAVILPESDGSNMASTENWTQSSISFALQEVEETLSWWTQQAITYSVPLEFVIVPNHPITVTTSYEPIKMIGLEEAYGDADIWINEVMANLGYNDPSMSYLELVQQYDDDLRDLLDADWVVTVFVVNGENDGDGLFEPGSWGDPNGIVTAWATRPGPYLVVNTHSALAMGWSQSLLGGIIAHELGHVFGAADETLSGGGDCTTARNCTAKFGYLKAENQNCDMTPSCSLDEPTCVMRVGDMEYLCPYSAAQVGWQDVDLDGIADPIDTTPQITVTNYPITPSTTYLLEYSAQIVDIPYPTTKNGYIPVTINDVYVQFKIGSNGEWITAVAGDGAWDTPYEEDFIIPLFSNGTYTIYIRASNEVGNTSLVINHTVIINSPNSVYQVFVPAVRNED